MLRILSIFGTRPEAIKFAPVIAALRSHPDVFKTRICVTGQHREMLDQVLELFKLVPDYDLNVMLDDQSLSYVTAEVLTRLERIVDREKPDWVLVQGDTTTTAAASLAAFYHKIKVGHIEAGLRTHDRFNPFPEETNRQIADALADIHFAPTERARQNLLHEGYSNDAIRVTGNTVIDALQDIAARPFGRRGTILDEPDLVGQRVILVTAHRRENFGQPIRNICAALRNLATKYSREIEVVYPVHMNPNVRRVVYELLEGLTNVHLLPPLDYEVFVRLMQRAYLILTDSGGLQEEAPTFGVPVLVLRDRTERPEAIEAGTAQLVGTDTNQIVKVASKLLDNESTYAKMAHAVNPFGDGRASHRIASFLLESVGT
jgi:UDP-N-acetylglucosamine 2-epimerase (non-hydrolysing)